MVSIITVSLLLIQPISALGMVFNNNMEPVLIAEGDSVDESHEGASGSQRKGGYGQGGSGQGGSASKGSGSADSGSSEADSGGSGGSKGSGGSSGSSGGKPVETGGTKTLNVTVVWPEGVTPMEVKVTLTNYETSQTKETVDGKVTFLTEPGDEWDLIGEAVPGFKVPLVDVAIKGTDEVVNSTLTYEEGNIAPDIVVLNKTKLELFVGDTETLSAIVTPINANNKTVVWASSSNDIVTVENGIVSALAEGTATITVKSSVIDTVTATCEVIVKPLGGAVRVDGITLDINQINLDLGENDTYELKATVSPENATVKEVLWSSSNNNVASVDEDGKVTANSQGFAVITATTVDGGYYALAQVSVGAASEEVYIYPFSESSTDEHFDDPYEVLINVQGLVAKLLSENALHEAGVTYYVKVTEKGTTVPLGEGTVLITNDSVKFNLYEETNFELTDNNSARYFVYMSQYPDYPKDDEKTLMTNFMGGSSTPTIPLENIRVKVKMYGGTRSVEGIYVLLAREEYEGTTLEEVSWREFYETTPPQDPYPENGSNGVDINNFIDEVKLKGISDKNGVVQWFEPKETVKLGGYLLLEITPNGYKDNLNMINPASDDGDLLKQVTLMRDGYLDVEISNIYVGNGSNDNPPVNPPVDPPVDPPVNPPIDPPVNPPSGDGSKTDNDSIGKRSVLPKEEYVNIKDTEKFNGHWAKVFIDNIIQRKNMPKSLFDKISNLDDNAYTSDLIELDSFINNTNGSFISDSNLPISRQQGIVMLMTSFGFSPEDEPLSFIDQNEIDASAKEFIAAACKLGIVSGYPDNSFRPNRILTKAELLTIASKCLDIKYLEVVE